MEPNQKKKLPKYTREELEKHVGPDGKIACLVTVGQREEHKGVHCAGAFYPEGEHELSLTVDQVLKMDSARCKGLPIFVVMASATGITGSAVGLPPEEVDLLAHFREARAADPRAEYMVLSRGEALLVRDLRELGLSASDVGSALSRNPAHFMRMAGKLPVEEQPPEPVIQRAPEPTPAAHQPTEEARQADTAKVPEHMSEAEMEAATAPVSTPAPTPSAAATVLVKPEPPRTNVPRRSLGHGKG